MAGARREDAPKKNEFLGIKVTADDREKLLEICDAEDRPLGYVARELMLYGLAVYDRAKSLKGLKKELEVFAPETRATSINLGRDTNIMAHAGGELGVCMNCGKQTRDLVCSNCGHSVLTTKFLSRADLDELPFGAVRLALDGTILAFNKAERELSRVGHKRLMGRNFFDEIAPCSNVKEFRGRWEKFLKSRKQSEEFEFNYHFKSGDVHVRLAFFRENSEVGYVVSSRTDAGKQHKAG